MTIRRAGEGAAYGALERLLYANGACLAGWSRAPARRAEPTSPTATQWLARQAKAAPELRSSGGISFGDVRGRALWYTMSPRKRASVIPARPLVLVRKWYQSGWPAIYERALSWNWLPGGGPCPAPPAFAGEPGAWREEPFRYQSCDVELVLTPLAVQPIRSCLFRRSQNLGFGLKRSRGIPTAEAAMNQGKPEMMALLEVGLWQVQGGRGRYVRPRAEPGPDGTALRQHERHRGPPERRRGSDHHPPGSEWRGCLIRLSRVPRPS